MRRVIMFPVEGAPTLEEEQPFFCMANKVLVGSALPLNRSYCQIGQRVYATSVDAADFGEDAEGERRSANRYCRLGAGVTGDILPERCALSADTGIVLLSSAAVRTASWKQPVTEKMSPFGDVEAARTLRSRAVYGYARLQWPSLQAVDVPLSCDAFSVTVLLPSGSLDELCHNLTAEAGDASSIVSRAYRHVVDNIPSTSREALPDVELLVNKPFVLCVRKMDIVVLLACIQNVRLSSP
ncbi:hypothetical protein V5799_002884 [Amblyomma americanum]|uniref:Serpin domain-containing protein n=1 Tax=Amblyomma americanum TaxID=6943 RepID=A0AAQ4DAJ3_AMBAM